MHLVLLLLKIHFPGFSTAKGDLVRSILFPKPMDFRFYQDAMRFIMVLAVLAACGMAYSIYTLVSKGVNSISFIILTILKYISIYSTLHYKKSKQKSACKNMYIPKPVHSSSSGYYGL